MPSKDDIKAMKDAAKAAGSSVDCLITTRDGLDLRHDFYIASEGSVLLATLDDISPSILDGPLADKIIEEDARIFEKKGDIATSVICAPNAFK